MTEKEILIEKLVDILKRLPTDRLRVAYVAIREIEKRNPG